MMVNKVDHSSGMDTWCGRKRVDRWSVKRMAYTGALKM